MPRLPNVSLLGLLALATLTLVPACTSLPPRPPVTAAQRAREEVEAAERYEDSEASAPPAVHGAALSQVLALRPKLDAIDRAQADGWIAAHVKLLGELHRDEAPSRLARVGPVKTLEESPLRQAERRFARWTLETRYDRHDESFARALFLLPVDALPGLDRFALGIEAVAAGSGAAGAFFVYCGRSRETAEKLVAWVAQRRQAALARQVFDSVLLRDTTGGCERREWSRDRAVPEFVRLWNASIWWPEVWTAAADALVATHVDLGDALARSALHQAWMVWPERRGMLLWVIGEAARANRSFRGADPGAEFEQQIGPRPTKKDVAAMLAIGPAALPALAQIWRAKSDRTVDKVSAAFVTKALGRGETSRGWGAAERTQQLAVASLAVEMCRDHQRGATDVLRSQLRATGMEKLLDRRQIAARCRPGSYEPDPFEQLTVPEC